MTKQGAHLPRLFLLQCFPCVVKWVVDYIIGLVQLQKELANGLCSELLAVAISEHAPTVAVETSLNVVRLAFCVAEIDIRKILGRVVVS